MERKIITEKMINYLCEKYLFEPHEINENSKLEDDLALDSLDKVEFVMEMEKEFDLFISDTDAEINFNNDIKTAVDYLYKKLNK